MAGVRAVAATCEAVRHVLESAAAADGLGFDMQFQVYGPADFGREDPPITTGVSVFLYRVLPNLSHRTPAGCCPMADATAATCPSICTCC